MLGSVTYTSALLLDLTSSQAIQRLRMVGQAGASQLVRAGRNVTRYEHSLGVMVLTARLGGIDLEQAAGLLQDVSHTAFSHTIDYVFEDWGERFHERIHRQVLDQSDIPEILDRHGLGVDDVVNGHNLRRVEAPSPLLCADRIDYTLRDLTRLGDLSATDTRPFLDALAFRNGMVVVADLDAALSFAHWYHHLVRDVFMDPLELYAHDELARLLREGMRFEIISRGDLLTNDRIVLEKLRADHRHGLAQRLAELEATRSVTVGDVMEGRHVKSKVRIVDPPVLTGQDIVPLSTLIPETKRLWDDIRDAGARGTFVSGRQA